MKFYVTLAVVFGTAIAIQDASDQTQFTPSLEGVFEEGIGHLRSSWETMWDELPADVTYFAEHEMEILKPTKLQAQKGVPAGRQQMYFRPVSTTLICVMILTICCLLVYTALSASRNYDELSATFTPSL